MTPDPVNSAPQKQNVFWRRTRRLTLQLLLAWFLVTFVTIFFARELSDITLFGWPFSFYMAAQGATLVYLLIVGIFAWRMRHLGKAFNNDSTDGQ